MASDPGNMLGDALRDLLDPRLRGARGGYGLGGGGASAITGAGAGAISGQPAAFRSRIPEKWMLDSHAPKSGASEGMSRSSTLS